MSKEWLFTCDWCGFQMVHRHCKVVCPNCGGRWDCSDVTIWLGDGRPAAAENPPDPQHPSPHD